MKVPATIKVVWNLAAYMAIDAKHKEIAPEHFFLILLTLSEKSDDEIDEIGIGPEVVQQFKIEILAIRKELKNRSIDVKQVIKDICKQLGGGSYEHNKGVVHRSQASRDLFDGAAKLARDRGFEVLTTNFLLEAILTSPTPVIAKALGKAIGPGLSQRTPTPLLDEYGKDLIKMLSRGKPAENDERLIKSSVLVLVNHLKKSSRPFVLMISDDHEVVHSIIMTAVEKILSSENNYAMKSKRILDITAVSLHSENVDGNIIRLNEMLSQAVKAPEVILYIPAIENSPDHPVGSEWVDLLESVIKKGPVKCIGRITPSAYRDRFEKNTVWKRLAEFMWIEEVAQDEVPWEI